MPLPFLDRSDRLLGRVDSLLCVGLDPDPARMPRSLAHAGPKSGLRRFLKGVIDATLPSAGAFKFQLASYLAYGAEGLDVLEETVQGLRGRRVTILDLKANDVPNTMRLWQTAVFGRFGFDAVTLTPWMGRDSLDPFAADPAHGIFLVAHSSNPGAIDLQDPPGALLPPWLKVARWAREIARTQHNAGIVVGATYPHAVGRARKVLGENGLLLIPGVGAQGGELEASVRAGVGAHGRGLLINASRSILFASPGKDWARAAGAEAERLRDRINAARR